MAEPWLPPEERFAIWEPVADQLRVIGWRPGPAGVSAVEVATGLHVVVDHARPSTLTDVVVDLDDGRVPDAVVPLLASVVGDDAAKVLATLPRRSPVDRPVALPTGRRRIDDPFPAPASASATFVRLALGVDLGDDADRPPLARAVALLEGALAGLALHRPLGHDLARQALDLVAGAGLDDPFVDQKLRASIRGLLAAVAAALADSVLAAAARRAVAHADEPRRPAASARVASSFSAHEDLAVHLSELAAPAAPAKMGGAADAGEAWAPSSRRPVEVDGEHQAWAWLDAGNHVQITARASADGTWGRVFRRRDRLLLGLSPVRGGATLVVIPPHEPDDIVVDLTDRPASAQPAPSRLLVAAAVTAGRRAARLSRLGDPDAGVAWSACAEVWTELGDVQRANLAERHGGRDGRRAWSDRRIDDGPAPLVADRID